MPGRLRDLTGPGDRSLTRLQEELLLELFEGLRRFNTGALAADSTVWSQVTYRLAKAHRRLLPSPATGRFNMERRFESRVHDAAKRLVGLSLASWRDIKPAEPPAAFALGYKRHKSRVRDLFLTEEGYTAAEARLRAAGRMAADDEMSACEEAPPPAGPLAGGLSSCDD